jgi:hypothetical protein
MFFHDAAIPCPPLLPIPGNVDEVDSRAFASKCPPHKLPKYMGRTFPTLCKFWTIVQEVLVFYLSHIGDSVPLKVPLSFAESKYQKLLHWADAVENDTAHGEYTLCHALIFQ